MLKFVLVGLWKNEEFIEKFIVSNERQFRVEDGLGGRIDEMKWVDDEESECDFYWCFLELQVDFFPVDDIISGF